MVAEKLGDLVVAFQAGFAFGGELVVAAVQADIGTGGDEGFYDGKVTMPGGEGERGVEGGVVAMHVGIGFRTEEGQGGFRVAAADGVEEGGVALGGL